MLKAKLLAGGGTAATLYAEDVFSAYTYTGNSSTQTITNGIDLAGKGGLVWAKSRGSAFDNLLTDTVRGGGKCLVSNATYSESGSGTSDISGFTSTGFTLQYAGGQVNSSADKCVGWTFRRAEKFFDVVTYTGNGANRTVTHSLGQAPGMIIIKRTDTTSNWGVYHRSLANTEYLSLNLTDAKNTSASFWNSTTADASTFTVATATAVNASGGTYVAYLFAHDTGTDGLIQCGGFTTDGSGNATVNLGWEPQYILVKNTNGAAGGEAWNIFDTTRAWSVLPTTTNEGIQANTSAVASAVYGSGWPILNSTGFTLTGAWASRPFIYLAIRRPNKPPTTGTQVYNAIARTGTGAAATVTGVGFAPDLVHIKRRTAVDNNFFGDRLRGSVQALYSDATAAEAAFSNGVVSLGMDGMSLGTGTSVNATDTIINHFFKRAPGVFDVVCYTGTGAATTVSHGLGAVPELMIVRNRPNAGSQWVVYSAALANTEHLLLSSTAAKATVTTYWNSTTPTSSSFTIGTASDVNQSATAHVAYLFATLAGISKVGSYTGNGSSQTIDCGFTTGARFVMIKRTDSNGDWYMWDTTRGIIAGNDPYLLLNSTAAEVTGTDYIDPSTSGFELSSTAPAAINASGGTFIYLAFS